MPDEWLGELNYTHYLTTLSSLTGATFEQHWTSLLEWERTAWIEAAKATLEAAIALEKQR